MSGAAADATYAYWDRRAEEERTALAKVRGASKPNPKAKPIEPYLPMPVHGERGWMLAKYEWRPDGTACFMYVRNTGERRSVTRQQRDWL